MRGELVGRDGVTVTLRAARAEDEPFLYALYADRRAPDLAPLGWAPAQVRAFLELQFRAQQQGYAAAYGDADHWLVLEAGEPVGRLLVWRGRREHRLVDVVILARGRGRGIGGALLQAVIDDARAAAVPLRLSVAADDVGLIDWYRRLGFEVVEHGDVRLTMVRPADSAPGL